MTDNRKNVVWTELELGKIAAFMLVAMARDPALSLLKAVRSAQDSLGPGRQRNIQAWSMVEPKVGPVLDAMRKARAQGIPATVDLPSNQSAQSADAVTAAKAAKASTAASVSTGPEPLPSNAGPEQDLPLESIVAPQSASASASASDPQSADASPHDPSPPTSPTSPAPPAPPAALRASASATLSAHAPAPAPSNLPIAADPLQFEAALLVALQSPMVEQALADLMGAAMARAFERFSASHSGGALAEDPPRDGRTGTSDVRVLVAGFPDSQAKAMVSALDSQFDVRLWKPHQTPQMLDAAARICVLAIVPEEAPEDFQEHLVGLGLQVLRHEGSVGRLAGRVTEALVR